MAGQLNKYTNNDPTTSCVERPNDVLNEQSAWEDDVQELTYFVSHLLSPMKEASQNFLCSVGTDNSQRALAETWVEDLGATMRLCEASAQELLGQANDMDYDTQQVNPISNMITEAKNRVRRVKNFLQTIPAQEA